MLFVGLLPALVIGLQVGSLHTARVKSIQSYGAFLSLDGSRDGLVHISELDPGGGRLASVDAVISIGDSLRVRVLAVDGTGKISLTARGVSQPAEAPSALQWTAPSELGKPPSAAELERLDCVSFSYARSGGAGGQNVNKLSTKCTARLQLSSSPWPEAVRSRLRRGATSSGEIVLSAERQRTQAANRKEALERLEKLVAAAWYPPKVRRQYEGISNKGKRQRREDKSKVAQKKRDRSASRRGVFETRRQAWLTPLAALIGVHWTPAYAATGRGNLDPLIPPAWAASDDVNDFRLAKARRAYSPLPSHFRPSLSGDDAMALELLSRYEAGVELTDVPGMRVIEVMDGAGPVPQDGGRVYIHYKLCVPSHALYRRPTAMG